MTYKIHYISVGIKNYTRLLTFISSFLSAAVALHTVCCHSCVIAIMIFISWNAQIVIVCITPCNGRLCDTVPDCRDGTCPIRLFEV